jgi:Fe-S-cluster containining protein
VPDDDTSGDLAAGDFSAWVQDMLGALRGERSSDVPCLGCTACCRASQFVHVAPDEADTLAHIPPALLFPAPRMPRGHMILGHDERGHCPLLVDDLCSIYQHRPRACRTYDCRIFAAAGLEPDGEAQAEVRQRIRRWRFTYPSPSDRVEGSAVRSAARFVSDHPEVLPDDVTVSDTTQRAVLALRLHRLFVGGDGDHPAPADPTPEAIRVELRRSRARGSRADG